MPRCSTSTSYFRHFTPPLRSMARWRLHADSFNLLQLWNYDGVWHERKREGQQTRRNNAAISRTRGIRETKSSGANLANFPRAFKRWIRRSATTLFSRDSALIRHRGLLSVHYEDTEKETNKRPASEDSKRTKSSDVLVLSSDPLSAITGPSARPQRHV